MFNEAERAEAFRQKKKFWIIFGVATGVMLALNAVILVFRFTWAYDTLLNPGRRGWMLFLNIFVTAVYGCGCLFFFAVKYKLIRSFIRMLKGFDKGLREERMGIFQRFEDDLSSKDGVSCYMMITKEQYDKRGTLNERMILIEATREKPDFSEGDFLHYFTHANILVEYEVLRKAPPKADADGDAEAEASADANMDTDGDVEKTSAENLPDASTDTEKPRKKSGRKASRM